MESDPHTHTNRFDITHKAEMLAIIQMALSLLRAICPKAHICNDVGQPRWLSDVVATELFIKAGDEMVYCISLNVVNSYTTNDC